MIVKLAETSARLPCVIVVDLSLVLGRSPRARFGELDALLKTSGSQQDSASAPLSRLKRGFVRGAGEVCEDHPRDSFNFTFVCHLFRSQKLEIPLGGPTRSDVHFETEQTELV